MNLGISRGELIGRRFFKYFFPRNIVFYNFRPDWLKWKSGHNLELDIYYPELKIAFEFMGIHHKLESQIEKDNFKRDICAKQGIHLYEARVVGAFHTIKRLIQKELGYSLPKLPDFLKKELKNNNRSTNGKWGKYVNYYKKKISEQKERPLFNELRTKLYPMMPKS